MVTCPVCDGAIDVDEEDVDEGDTVSCDECGADLKVVSTSPLELESAATPGKLETARTANAEKPRAAAAHRHGKVETRMMFCQFRENSPVVKGIMGSVPQDGGRVLTDLK